MAKNKQKKQPQVQTPELFTVYYMNQDKVFEMRMLLDNRLRTGHTGEKTGTTSSEANINAEADARVPFLTELQGRIEGKIGHEKQTRMVDTLEYIHTKSRMLSDIIARCNIFEGTRPTKATSFTSTTSIWSSSTKTRCAHSSRS